MDYCEMDAPDIYGNTWFCVIVDRSTDFMWIIPLKDRKQLWKHIEQFIKTVVQPYHATKNKELLKKAEKMVETQASQLAGLRNVRTDCGTEFANADMTKMLQKYGAKLDKTAPYKKDGRAEAAIKKITAATRTCLVESGLRKCFWGPISDMVVHTLNRVLIPKQKMTPYQALTGLVPDVSHLRQPGCQATVHIMDEHRRKLDDTAFIGRLINYDEVKRCWVFYNPGNGKNVHAQYTRGSMNTPGLQKSTLI